MVQSIKCDSGRKSTSAATSKGRATFTKLVKTGGVDEFVVVEPQRKFKVIRE